MVKEEPVAASLMCGSSEKPGQPAHQTQQFAKRHAWGRSDSHVPIAPRSLRTFSSGPRLQPLSRADQRASVAATYSLPAAATAGVAAPLRVGEDHSQRAPDHQTFLVLPGRETRAAALGRIENAMDGRSAFKNLEALSVTALIPITAQQRNIKKVTLRKD